MVLLPKGDGDIGLVKGVWTMVLSKGKMAVQLLWNCMVGDDSVKVNLQREAWSLVPEEGEVDARWAKNNLPPGSQEQARVPVCWGGARLAFWLPFLSIALTW